MKKNWFAFLLFAVLYFYFPGFSPAQTEDSRIYFNAGTEKYLQGDYQAALENLGRALEIDPTNAAARQLLIKVAQDGASRQHMNRNYLLAKQYLEYARRYVKNDSRIEDLYKLTMDILQRSPESNKVPLSATPEKKMVSPGETVLPKEKTSPPTIVVEKIRQEVPVPVTVEKKVVDTRLIVEIIAGFLLLVLLTVVIVLVKKSQKLQQIIKELKEKEVQLNQKNTELLVQLEKHKERLELQKEMINRLNATLKEQEKKEKERLQWEMEKISSVIPKTPLPARVKSSAVPAGHYENLNTSLEMSTLISENSISALQVARERIANLLYNLYAYSPQAAMDFVNRTLASVNPLIRANIILGLARIAQPETVEKLLELWRTEKDERVRREILLALKELRDKLQLSTILLPEELAREIKKVVEEEKRRGEWIF